MYSIMRFIRTMIEAVKSNPFLYKGSLDTIRQSQTVTAEVAIPIVILSGDTNATNMSAKIDELVVAVNNLAIENSNSIDDIAKVVKILKVSTGHGLILDYSKIATIVTSDGTYTVDNATFDVEYPSGGTENILDFIATLSSTDKSIQTYYVYDSTDTLKMGVADVFAAGDYIEVVAEDGIIIQTYTTTEGI